MIEEDGSSRVTLDRAEQAYFSSLQESVSGKNVRPPKDLGRICGADAAYSGDRVVAVASVMEGGVVRDRGISIGKCTFPYVSGLFYLREGPFVVDAVRRLRIRPDLVCFDAHGAAHPRFSGLATVCGTILGIPSVGIAKSLLVGRVVPGEGRPDMIVVGKRRVGFVVRDGKTTRYWSPGYSVSANRLKLIIQRYSAECLAALADSDHRSREELTRQFHYRAPTQNDFDSERL
jgi:deoxyribonuclease V